jgi:23S rRNA (cytidine1920-2'-O)/16S rRNA (cytidine1409-2'-O)-methyltransferase
MNKLPKKRLDVLMLERGLAETRAKAQAMIMAGEVSVNGDMVDKAGTSFAENAEIVVQNRPPFVSRGGEKLLGALQVFKFDVTNLIAVDVGASTGGFTDCLLQNGIKKVYAIDVGYGQLAHKIRSDERVVVMERTNARYVESLPEPIQLVVIDASFISLKIILPAVMRWLANPADVIALIKPQFEAGKNDVGKGGVVRDKDIHTRVLYEVLAHAQSLGFSIQALTLSPLKGPAGNIEFLVWLGWQRPATTLSPETLITQALP